MRLRGILLECGMLLAGAALAFAAATALTGAAHADEPPTVSEVDLNRYVGTWYEIASFPQSFQRGCVATTAEYALRPDGKISVTNSCRLNSLDGQLRVARGVARSVDPSNAKLAVSFFWPFEGDYWIFELGDSYEYAVVGAPDRDSLWILSRTRTLPSELLDEIVGRTESVLGFDVSRLNYTLQPPESGENSRDE